MVPLCYVYLTIRRQNHCWKKHDKIRVCLFPGGVLLEYWKKSCYLKFSFHMNPTLCSDRCLRAWTDERMVWLPEFSFPYLRKMFSENSCRLRTQQKKTKPRTQKTLNGGSSRSTTLKKKVLLQGAWPAQPVERALDLRVKRSEPHTECRDY